MIRRSLVWLCLILVLLSQSAPVSAQEEPAKKTVVLAGSDFQNYDGYQNCQDQMLDIFSAMKRDGLSSADGFLFCGDYSVEYSADLSNTGIRYLHETLDESGLNISQKSRVLVQGNHDVFGTTGLSELGENDPESGEYGVFVIHEDKFMWYSGVNGHNGSTDVSLHEWIVQSTAQSLRDYLQEKQEQGFTRPIFVVSHLPLHYSMRTRVYGDSCYASYLFNVLNEGAQNGLNIVFLYGHNHSNGWDNHLGGASVFLQKGDTIRLSHPKNRYNFYEKTLYFTYLNAGYVGYFTTPENEPVDKTLTMTRFEFDDQTLTIKRYSKDGVVNLRAQGTYNQKVFNGTTEERLGLYQPIATMAVSPHVLPLISAYQPGKKPTCQEEGQREYYYVEANDAYYQDVLLTKRLEKTDIPLEKLSHVPGEPIYLDTDYHQILCKICQQEIETQKHSLTNNACTDCGYGRILQHQAYKPATCQEDGWIEHYFDPNSNQCYRDAQGSVALTPQQVILPKTEHDFTHSYLKEEGGHRGKCHCGQTEDRIAQHSFQNNECFVCHYQRPAPVTTSTIPPVSTTVFASTAVIASATQSTVSSTVSPVTTPHPISTAPASLPADASTQAPQDATGAWLGIGLGVLLAAGAGAGGFVWHKRKSSK